MIEQEGGLGFFSSSNEIDVGDRVSILQSHGLLVPFERVVVLHERGWVRVRGKYLSSMYKYYEPELRAARRRTAAIRSTEPGLEYDLGNQQVLLFAAS